MCSLHLTHPSGGLCVAQGAVQGSVPCSRVSPQSWTLPAGAGIRTHNLGLPRVSSPTLLFKYSSFQNSPEEGFLMHRTCCMLPMKGASLTSVQRTVLTTDSRQQPDKAAGGRRNGWPQSGRHQIEWQHADEHMFWAVDYDRAQLFPVQLHFQFPAQHFSFITVISG